MKIFLVILSLLLIAGWFYWFQVRPSEAKKACFTQLADSEKATVSNAKLLFELCLHKKGL